MKDIKIFAELLEPDALRQFEGAMEQPFGLSFSLENRKQMIARVERDISKPLINIKG